MFASSRRLPPPRGARQLHGIARDRVQCLCRRRAILLSDGGGPRPDPMPAMVAAGERRLQNASDRSVILFSYRHFT